MAAAVATIAIGCLGATAASAAAVIVDQTFDLGAAIVTPTSVTSNNNTGFNPTFSNSNLELISNGDSVDYTVSFLPGQGLAFTGPTFGLFRISLISPDFVSVQENPNEMLKLFDNTGALITTLGVNGFTSTQPTLVGSTFGNIGVPLSGTIGSIEYINPDVTGLNSPTHFNSAALSLTATSLGGFQVVTVPILTPEPEAWALMLIGFFSVGGLMRWRVRKPA
ncbi:hypothetical protein [Phenylobacterium sp.]|uniref:hypothetical protein n=1 Tax=Phenylobacterium sp. TaxID=1871053 RepID=UPI002F4107FF